MDDAIKLAIIDHLPTIVTACLAGIAAILSAINHKKLDSIHLELNSRLDQLLIAAKAQGRIDERSRADAEAKGLNNVQD